MLGMTMGFPGLWRALRVEQALGGAEDAIFLIVSWVRQFNQTWGESCA